MCITYPHFNQKKPKKSVDKVWITYFEVIFFWILIVKIYDLSLFLLNLKINLSNFWLVEKVNSAK